MGDRCHMNVWVRKENYVDFCEQVLGEYVNPATETRSWACVEVEEINWGAYEERCQSAKNGLIFFGTCSPGTEYDAEVFYSDGKKLHSQSTGVLGSGYIVPMKNRKVRRGATAAINKFDKAWKELHEDMRKELVEQVEED